MTGPTELLAQFIVWIILAVIAVGVLFIFKEVLKEWFGTYNSQKERVELTPFGCLIPIAGFAALKAAPVFLISAFGIAFTNRGGEEIYRVFSISGGIVAVFVVLLMSIWGKDKR